MKYLLLVLACALPLAGCNSGMAPAPMADADVKKAIDSMTPEKRIKFIQGSPASPEEKAKQIAEIEKKYGIKAEAGGGPPNGR